MNPRFIGAQVTFAWMFSAAVVGGLRYAAIGIAVAAVIFTFVAIMAD